MKQIALQTIGFLLLATIGLAVPQPTRAQYVHTFGDVSFDEGADVGLDAAGNAYFTGFFRDTLSFNPDPDAGSPVFISTQEDLYVVSYDPAGAYRFAFPIGNEFATSEAAGGIAVDASGTFYVTGSQPFGAIDFNPADTVSDARSGEFFVASYTADGAFRWADAPAGANPSSFATGTGIALGATGNVYVIGHFVETIVFDATEGVSVSSEGASDIFFAGYTPDGDLLFARRLGGPGDDRGFGIAADSEGNVYVTGRFRETVSFNPDDPTPGADPEERTANGTDDVFFAGYTAEGAFRFAYTMGGESLAISEEGNGIGIDAQDNVYLTGTIAGTIDFDPSEGVAERTAHPNGSAFLAGYTADGAHRFARVLDTPSQGLDLATGADGTSYVTGSFSGTVTFDDDEPASAFSAGAGNDVFVAAYEATGNYRSGSAFAFGGNGLNAGHGIAVDAAENVVLTGAYTNTTDFDPGAGVDERTAGGQQDIFMALFPAGSVGTAAEDTPAEGPETFVLAQNYPNPFNPQTTIPYSVPEAGPVRLDVFDLLGRRVATLVQGNRAAGAHTAVWDAAAAPSGVYVYRLEAGNHVEIRTMTLLR